MIFLLKLSFLLFRPGDELLMFLALGMEGLVTECLPDGSPVFQKLLVAQPAAALTFVDPVNLVQNTLTAIRTLEQINNQIKQLQNEAQM